MQATQKTIKLLTKQAQAPIPTQYGTFQTVAYAFDGDNPMPHIALINPDTDFSAPVNLRVHSECMTGDLFGSYRCECGEQLHWSMDYISEHGGVIIYLRQEGRGIGLINKLHAYTKQDEGLNTAEANKALGFGYDERTYEDAITILDDLGIKEIRLLTNNPKKIKSLDIPGLTVLDRIPIEIPPREENKNYLKTKKEFFGHKLQL
ncbi:MAG TPA: GTP cyclohydrolase II [Gammaproteobacteria bacterium]|nr:GTP cyclohydrolase II [Gammaproteobacteria bacterium]